MIVFRLGRIRNPQGPGMVLLLPFIDSFQRVDLRTRAFNVPPCKLASKDGAVLSVGADVQFRIWDPVLSVMAVKDLNTATRMTAHNAMTDTLEMINEVEPPASLAGAGPEPSPKQPVAEGLLTALQPFLSEALVSQVGACYQFNVILPSGTQSIYFLDLTTGQGRVGHGEPDGIPDVVVEMAEADLQALLSKELRPLGAYMSGRLKVKGDLAVVMKLEAVLKALK